jgi:uncharacterized protein (TIGR03083 family)
MLDLVRRLDVADWTRPTDCAGWTVRDVVAHLCGLVEESVRLRVMVRHIRTARHRYPASNLLDGTNAVQLDDRRGAAPARLCAEFARLAPRAVRARKRTPALIRRLRPPAGFALPPDIVFGQVLDVILVRDAWMHRIDIARACGLEPPLIETDAEVVAQVIRDLDRHWSGPPITLELSGPVGGRWLLGEDEPVATARADAVDFCRSLSGRPGDFGCEVGGNPAGNLEVQDALRAARVIF